MTFFGTSSWDGIGCMTLGDWITSFLVLYLDKLSTNDCGKNTYLLQGENNVDFGGLGLCGGGGMGRGLGWWFFALRSKYGESHEEFGLDGTWELWSLKHGGRGCMSWKVDFFFWPPFCRLRT